MKKGFTLIETVIYLALFAILVAGFFTAAYAILESQNRVREKVIADGEANFVMGKITWALEGGISIIDPSLGNTSTKLVVSKTSLPGGESPLTFNLLIGAILLSRGGGVGIPLTNSAVPISNLSFSYLSDVGGEKYVLVKFEADKKLYERKFYLGN